MFSRTYDLLEATENARSLSAIYHFSSLGLIADDVKDSFGIDLNIGRLNSGKREINIGAKEVSLAKEALSAGY